MITLVLAAEAAKAGESGSAGALYAVIGGVVTALFVLVGQLLLRRQQKDKLIAEASSEVAEGARTLLEQYRTALESANAERNELRERIAKLEQSLADARADHERLQKQRESAIRELATVQERVNYLEEQIRLIDGGTVQKAAAEAREKRENGPSSAK